MDCLMRRINREWMRLRAEIHNLYTCSLFDIIKKNKRSGIRNIGGKEKYRNLHSENLMRKYTTSPHISLNRIILLK